jgi:H+/gluconate symporter-like permease
MRERGKEPASRILVWGAAWGLAESTIGYILHYVPIPGLAGMIMVPLGLFFMGRVYREAGHPTAILSVSAVAALLKLSNFFLPGRGPVMTLRPVTAILLEGLLVAALYAALPLVVRRKA